MTISVASYLKGIPAKNTKQEKPAVITGFIEGVLRNGDVGTVVNDWQVIDTDVAVVQGFVHETSKKAPHLALRQKVLSQQKQNNKRSIIIDSNLFLYADPSNVKGYLRYSYDGVFPNTGEYCNRNPDPARWDKISKDLGIRLKPWKTSGSNILICCQRDGGWSMAGEPIIPWLLHLIKKIKAVSDRTIVVRFHPGDKKSMANSKLLLSKQIPGVRISTQPNILEDFKTAHVAISYNSSPAVVAAIEGVPVIVLDPDRSQAADVSTHNLNCIENLPMYDREQWIKRMAQMHWTLDEVKNGTAWQHLRNYAIR